MIQVAFGIMLAVASTTAQVTLSTSFSCRNRTSGYYADMETGCQVYHMCDTVGRQFSYTCPNATLFHQRMLICDHWYMVNCNQSESDYRANLRIGQPDKLFVEDSEVVAYDRTPRSDLLSNSKPPEYLVYKMDNARSSSNFNFMGSAAKSKNRNADPDRRSNTLPRNRFNALSKIDNSPQNQKKSAEVRRPKSIENNELDNEKEKKFEAKVKQPTKVNDVKEKLNPKVYNKILIAKNKNVEPLKSSNVTESPVAKIDQISSSILKALQPKPQDVKSTPSSFNTNNLEINVSVKDKIDKTLYDEQHLKELRKLYLIPDYEFPLDTVSRPGYDDVPINYPPLTV